MATCPFHNDKHPSMKIDQRYYCFGCGAKGDCIGYVASMFGLSQFEAAKKINGDFNLNISLNDYADWKIKKEKTREERIRWVRKKLEIWIENAKEILRRYLTWLEFWKTFYKPEIKKEWNPLFEEALKNETKIRYFLNILEGEEEEEKMKLFNDMRQEVEEIERRMDEYQRGIVNEFRKDYGGRDDDSRRSCRKTG